MECDSDDYQCTSFEILEATKLGSKKMLPEKSLERYQLAYRQFMEWSMEAREVRSSLSENVLMTYFVEISKKIAPSTLWTQYSMLRSTLNVHHNVDISKYLRLKALLQRKSVDYRPKKSKALTMQEINAFLENAPDNKYLFSKVAIIVGISGACRKDELCQLRVDDIEDLGSSAVIHVNNTKSKAQRTFILTGVYYTIFKKYAILRPEKVSERRFFLNYQNKRCTRQPVGINKIGAVPKEIAMYLKLENPKLYTGHCYRRSSAMHNII